MAHDGQMGTLRVRGLRREGLGPIDLEVVAGTSVGLIGPSGAGKTLLLRAIADLDPHDGTVSLDDVPSHRLPAPEWRRRVALVMAESQWWQDRVGEHFPPDRDPALLDALGLPQTVLEWSVARLSSGERQRLALARALANHPDVLLLDEPTAHLDDTSRERVERLIADYRAHSMAAVLWVGHDRDQLRNVASRQLRVIDGALVENA